MLILQLIRRLVYYLWVIWHEIECLQFHSALWSLSSVQEVFLHSTVRHILQAQDRFICKDHNSTELRSLWEWEGDAYRRGVERRRGTF